MTKKIIQENTAQQQAQAMAQFEAAYEMLNPEQREAVDAIEGPVMVLAGPGTGKTQVLAVRIARILQETQMDPWNILCLTFTESGVVAMRERLAKIIGTAGYYVRIHTFHSFCKDIIDNHQELFALTRDWQNLTDIERIQVLRAIIDGLPGTSPLKPFGHPYLYLPDIARNISQLKQENITPKYFHEVVKAIDRFSEETEETINDLHALSTTDRTDKMCDDVMERFRCVAEESKLPNVLREIMEGIYKEYVANRDGAETKKVASQARTAFKNALRQWHGRLRRQVPKQFEMVNVYEAYQEDLKKRGRYDYEDMILLVVKELKQNDNLLAEYQEQFQYILVDEYQDTNGAQNEIVQFLASFDEQPNVFVVGDDKQSIYRFQGASLTNMLEFYERYKTGVKVVSLRQNYRSQSNVLEASSAVIAHNRESLTRYIPNTTDVLEAATKRLKETFTIYEFESEAAEDYFTAEKCQELIKQGTQPSEIAVLYRNNSDGKSLLDTMQKLGVAARLETGEDVLQDARVQQWLRLLVYIADNKREDLLGRILLYDWWDIDPVDAAMVIHAAYSQRMSLFEVLSDQKLLSKLNLRKLKEIKGLFEKLVRWQKDAENEALPNFLSEVLAESGWLKSSTESGSRLAVLQKINTVLNEARRLFQANRSVTLTDFVKHLNLFREHNVPLLEDAWHRFESETAGGAVRLMTAHKAKGLEFEYVFMPRVNDHHWGNGRGRSKLPLPAGFVRYDFVADEENNEDERRLFYVALTRAKQNVFLTRAKHNNGGKPTAPALFLLELPEASAQKIGSEELSGNTAERIIALDFTPLPTKSGHRDLEVWLRSRLSSYVLNATHLNNYLACPRRFYFQNLLGIPSAQTSKQALGSAIHDALQRFHYLQRQGEKAGKKELLSLFSKRLEHEVLTESQFRDTKQKGYQVLTDYFDNNEKVLRQSALVEYDFRDHNVRLQLSKKTRHLEIPVTGKVDKIVLLSEDENVSQNQWAPESLVKVVDYKTANPDNKRSELATEGEYWRQLVFYKLLCDNSPRFSYQMQAGEINFIQKSNRTGKHMIKQYDITQDDVAKMLEIIERVWNEIHSLAFLHGSETPFCGECEYCREIA